MAKNTQNKNKSKSEIIPFNVSKFGALQYIKVIYVDSKKELHEIRTEVFSINYDKIQLFYFNNNKENLDITCPTGVALKLITRDAIYFAKAILKETMKASGKIILVLDTPRKTIRQQNRKFYRININCPCVLLINNDQNNSQTYIAQSVNISKGGILIDNIESMLNDEQVCLPLSKGDNCHIAVFLEQGLTIKLYAEFIRSESVDDSYRCAFQFINMSQKYITPFNKYITNEEFKLLKLIKNT